RTFAEEFQVGTDHTLLTQELGNGQNNIGGGNARLALASQLHTHDIRQTHHGRAAQHHSFRFQTTHANGDNTQRINVRRMAVGTHTGIREGDRVTVLIRAVLNHRRHLLQVDLVHDAVTGRNHVHVLERGAGPVDEMETVFVTTVFNGTVLLEGIRVETRG